ncbi:hypothetical protein BC828DRAFT_405531 [Blastocladiella britannica]|nr:hypothetical protein BC828DRAFT_405531 [Blastocladiella britannica]
MAPSPKNTATRRSGAGKAATKAKETAAVSDKDARAASMMASMRSKNAAVAAAAAARPVPRPTLTFKVANAAMAAVFFSFAYTSWASIDEISWALFYILCGCSALLHALSSLDIPVDNPVLPANLIGLYLLVLSVQKEGRFTFDGSGDPETTQQLNLFNMIDMTTEPGRDRAGIILSLGWVFASYVMPLAVHYALWASAAIMVALTAYAVPKYGVNATIATFVSAFSFPDASSSLADAPSSCGIGGGGSMPSSHQALFGGNAAANSGGCPITGKKVPATGDQESAAAAAAARAAHAHLYTKLPNAATRKTRPTVTPTPLAEL